MNPDDIMGMAEEYWQEKKVQLQIWIDSPIGKAASWHIRDAVREKIAYCDERISVINQIILKEQQTVLV